VIQQKHGLMVGGNRLADHKWPWHRPNDSPDRTPPTPRRVSPASIRLCVPSIIDR
jgi:hypothetical protein